MSFAGPTLEVVQGSDLSIDFEAYDSMNQLRSGDFQPDDAFAVTLWPAGATQDDALAVSGIACTWINVPLAQWRLVIPASVTGGLPVGVYRIWVRLTRVDPTTETGTLLYAELRVSGAGIIPGLPTPSPVPGLPTADDLSRLSVLWCTDEDIAIRCGPDFVPLLPDSQLLAEGADGVFQPADPWTLGSPSNDFSAQLPAAWTLSGDTGTPTRVGFVCHLRKPQSAFPAGGHLLATASVSGTNLTLRRIGTAANVGRAPSPAAGLVGVSFRVATFLPQIEEATYEINQRWGIDAGVVCRSASALADIRQLRRLCVAMVLLDRYTDESRTGTGDYSHKGALINTEIERLSSKLQLRWTTITNGQPAVSNWFSTRVVR